MSDKDKRLALGWSAGYRAAGENEYLNGPLDQVHCENWWGKARAASRTRSSWDLRKSASVASIDFSPGWSEASNNFHLCHMIIIPWRLPRPAKCYSTCTCPEKFSFGSCCRLQITLWILSSSLLTNLLE